MEDSHAHILKLCHAVLVAFDPLVGKQTEIAVDIARRMAGGGHFSLCEQEWLVQSAWLHNLGVVHLKRDLLHRKSAGSMAENDLDIYRGLPALSADLAKLALGSEEVAEAIRSHHERFDGCGYPNGFAGETISWGARCLAVATYFAESPLPKDELLNVIQEESGKGFDPEAVRLFFKTTQDDLPAQIREVLVEDLEPGMVLAKEIVAQNGLLLLPEASVLDASSIAKITNYNLLTALTQRLLVYR